MAWIFLLLAGMCEMVWPLGFKYTHGFKMHYWAVGVTFAILILSFWLMSLAINRGLPMGTVYAVWTGLGATGTAILGILFFHEPRDWVRLCCLGLIIAGVVGLKFLSPPEESFPTAAPAAAAAPQ